MFLEIKLGEPVFVEIHALDATDNPTHFPDGSTIELTSNDESVATVPDTIQLPGGGAAAVQAPVTVLAVGATDIHAKVTAPNGDVFEGTATLQVDPLPFPGMARIEVHLHAVNNP